MKFNKLTNRLKLSSALIAATTVIGSAILSMPLLLSTNSTNNKISSDNLDYEQLIDQDNNQVSNVVDMKSLSSDIQSFFANEKTKVYIQKHTNSYFAVVTKTDTDVLYAWGNNENGQLGINTKTSPTFPALVAFSGLRQYRITFVGSSYAATTVVLNDNAIWTSGSNTNFEHGDLDAPNTLLFRKSTKWTGGAIKSLHIGYHHRMVLTNDGRAWGWGSNDYGRIGNGKNTSVYEPLDITVFFDYVPNWRSGQLYLGIYNSAILVNGKLYIWGASDLGQLGFYNDLDSVAAPPADPLYFASNIKKYSMGGNHSLALLENGELWAWGDNSEAQLGINDPTVINTITPHKVTKKLDGSLITGVSDVFTSTYSSFIQIDNKIYSCGRNNYGMLAQGDTVYNNKIFSPVVLEPNAEIVNIIPATSSLTVNLKSGWYMAGSNANNEFVIGSKIPANNPVLTKVNPFGTPVKIVTKLDNTQYSASEIINDLNKADGNVSLIKSSLAKYVTGAENLIGTIMSYQSVPLPNADRTKISLTLSSNHEYNVDGVKVGPVNDIVIEITNISFDDSVIVIKKAPFNANTGTIQQTLNPTPGGSVPAVWWNELINMSSFPAGTTFVRISDDKVIPGVTSSAGIYEGYIYPSQYYYNKKLIINSDKGFHFQFKGLNKIPDSKFATNKINVDLNLDNYMTELPLGQPISAKYLPMFVDSTTFPTGAKFTINTAPIIDINKRTYSAILSFDKYYEFGLPQINGTHKFNFDNFKTIKVSEIVPFVTIDESIHSSNIKELLVDDTTNTIKKLVNMHLFPANTKFTISGQPTFDKDSATCTGKLFADKTYRNWAETIGAQELSFTFSNITIMDKSSVDYRQMPAGYDINNIEAKLEVKSGIINKEVLNQFIKTYLFPPKTEFDIGTIDKDTTSGKFTFDIIPTHYYVDGISTNNNITKTSYPITLQFDAIPVSTTNLGLIIGLSVGGAVVFAIISVICWMIYTRKHRIYV